MRNIALKTGLIALTGVLLAACGSQPRYYNDNNTSNYRSRCDTCGTIDRIERVQVRDHRQDQSGAGGAVLGAVIGGVIGSNIGSGDGRTVATAAGAVAGGVIGYQIQNNNNDRHDLRDAYQFDVNLDDGRWAKVTQLENPGLRVGSHVIIRDGQVYRLR